MPKRSATEADSEQPDWNTFTVPALKDALGLRGLSKMGRKAELVARLEGHASAQSDEGLATGPGGAAEPTARAPKAKKAKTRGPEPILEGPLASDVIEHQHVNPNTGERRQREFVPAPDAKFNDKIKKINKERMFMLDRSMAYDSNGHPVETYTIAGSTGNMYTCSIGQKPKCNCMDALMRGQKCKHINYALIIILKAPLHLQYQLAFLSEELEQIFANAPITRAPDLDTEVVQAPSDREVVRKPIDGECPICVFDMEPDEEIVWCRGACGQNFHKHCFEQWRRSKMGGRVTCVYCRTEWQDEGTQPTSALARLKESAPKIGSYKNIGHLSMYQKPGESSTDG